MFVEHRMDVFDEIQQLMLVGIQAYMETYCHGKETIIASIFHNVILQQFAKMIMCQLHILTMQLKQDKQTVQIKSNKDTLTV